MQYSYKKKATEIHFPGLLSFCFFWSAAFILYLPAARSGMEGDFPYWVQSIREHNFRDYVNTTSASHPVLYQFTQTAMYLIYRAFGLNAWLWHLLQVTLHAFACFLLFRICRKIFTDSLFERPALLAFAGAMLFCVAPHAAEAVVREPCYHYLQGLIFILAILLLLLRYADTQKPKYAWLAGGIYFVSIFSLEIFYLTPWIALALAIYYRAALGLDKMIFRRIILFFFLPELLLFILHLALMRLFWGNNIAHIGALDLSNPTALLSKPILYLFHLLFLGRYFSSDARQWVYTFLGSGKKVIAFYSIVALAGLLLVFYFRSIPTKVKAIALFSGIGLFALFLPIPLDFPAILHIIGDRYLYIPSAFIFMAVVLTISSLRFKYIAVMAYAAYLLLNVYFTIKINRDLYYAAAITKKLLTDIPTEPNKTILLLDLPSNMNGALMIRAIEPSEFKVMNHLFIEKNKIPNDVYDVCAYNMQHPGDGSNVVVKNDSTLVVTLNQWGAWWWRGDLGAPSYENDVYRVNIIDGGHNYELTLKHPASGYLALYQVGDEWKIVDWSKKDVVQN